MKSLLSILIISAVCVSQALAQDLQPPRKPLVAVHWPDLSRLEASVREQIIVEQNSLAAIVKNPATSDAELSEAYRKLGQIYHAYSLNVPARECYVNARILAPVDFRWPYLLGKLDQQEDRFEEAIRNYQAAQRLRPDYLPALVNLGNIFLQLNRLDDASASFQAALKLDENNAATHYGLGQVAMSKRRYTEAVQHFEKTLARTPGANRVHYSLAMAYRGLGNVEKVKLHLGQQGTVGVRVSDPLVDGLQDLITGERVYLSRGKLAFEAKRYADAAAEFHKAIAVKPNSVTARVNLGAALTQLGDLDGAAEQFEEAIRIEPEKGNAHYNLAVIRARQNKPEQAIDHLRAALRVDPNDVGARFVLAQQLLKAERMEEALAEFSSVVQADPNHESALLEQVKLLYRKGEFQQARDTLEKGHAQYPQKGRTTVLLAYVLAASRALDLRDGGRALILAQRVYQSTGAFEHGALVALALAELGRCSDAVELQRKVINAASQQVNADQLARLRAALKLYESGPTCRPPGQSLLAEPPL